MAITLTGSPQRLTPVYNPVYIYASSTNVTNPGFRYLVEVINFSDFVTLATLKIKPRYGDDLLEVNISKILASNIGVFSDDVNLNDPVLYGFNNTVSSGFRYSVNIGEEYEYIWDFEDVIFGTGDVVWLVSLIAPLFLSNDQVDVVDAAQSWSFTDNNFASGGIVKFLTPTNLTTFISPGYTVFIEQDPGFLYSQYNGYFTVTAVDATSVTVDFPYQGSSPVNPGVLTLNQQYDGLHLVEGTGTVVGGPYDGYYYVEVNQEYLDNSSTHAGSISYADGRSFSDPQLFNTKNYVFNGVMGHNEWINWNFSPYDPAGTGQSWLTTVANEYEVSLENDVFVNIWGKKLSGGMFRYNVKTYDSGGVLNGEFSILNPNIAGNQTEIQNLSVGPRGLNNAVYSTIFGSYPIIDCDVSLYSIQIENGFVTQSDTLTFSVACLCDERYTNYPMLFMDRFGSYIPMNFTLNNKQRVNIERQSYNSFIGGLSGAAYAYNTSEHSKRVYDVALEETWEINTDYMTEELSIYFEELITSPMAFILIDDQYVAVNIMDSTYERKMKNNTKLRKYTVNIGMSNNNTINI